MKKSQISVILLALVLSASALALEDSPNPQDWYERAREDLHDARLIFENTSHNDQVCFLSHQAVEKALKGALIREGIRPDRTHFTSELAGRLAKFYAEIKKYVRDLRKMDRLYVPSRYPKRGGIQFDRERASWCLEKAEEITQSVAK